MKKRFIMFLIGIIIVLVVIAVSILLARQKTYSGGDYFVTVIFGILLIIGIGLIRESGNGLPTRVNNLEEGAVYQVMSVYTPGSERLAVVKTTDGELLFIEVSEYQTAYLDTGKYYAASKKKFEGHSYIALNPLPDTGK